MTDTPTPSRRGFGAMSPERRREIAAKGGASVSADKRTFSRDRALAANAGAAGGRASKRSKTGTST